MRKKLIEGGRVDDSPAPFFFSDTIFKILDNALDWGIPESDFWDMTLAELERLFESKRRMKKQKTQEQAYFDYQLADLIGVSVGRIYNKSTKMPSIEEAYPNIFDAEKMQEEKQEKQDELSAARFKQFAEAFNKKFGKEDANE
jgi:hypothetical protein